MAAPTSQFPARLLKDTSRSFYLTLRVLPAAVRPQIGLAYLLARTTDTIADTTLVPLEQRLQALQSLRERILGTRDGTPELGELVRHQGSPAERLLLEQCDASLSLLRSLAAPDRDLVRQVLDTITSGQELDLRRFAAASAHQIVTLSTDKDLDDYTYRVAGCVGEFWTKICRAHLFPKAALDDSFLLQNGVRFGKGLQLVNILRDLAADLRQGRCYLPAERLSALSLKPADLLDPAAEPRLRPLYQTYLDLSEAHLRSGWAYTNALPRRAMRVRLACAWPILIGLRTLALLRTANPLDPQHPVKISRPEVKRILCHSVLAYPLPSAWRKLVRTHPVAADVSRR